jgi:hypothetical protein
VRCLARAAFWSPTTGREQLNHIKLIGTISNMSHRVLYIVGAGLTKALEETGNRVPLMADFLATMASHIDDPVIARALVKYELNGWFDWPSTEYGRQLAARIESGEHQALELLAKEITRRPGENVEHLLERSLSSGRSPNFVADINRLFWKIGFRLRLDLLRRFAEFQARAGGQHQVLSFNYDLAFERALQDLQLWNPTTGYGIGTSAVSKSDLDRSFQHAREMGGRKTYTEDDVRRIAIGGEQWEAVPSPWLIIKPHGSLNWVHVWVRYGEPELSVIADADALVAYAEDTRLPSSILAGGQSGIPVSVLIAPPGAKRLATFDEYRLPALGMTPPEGWRSKNERLADMQVRALGDADEVFVLGWSMPSTDAYHESLIRVCVHQRRQKIRRLVVVNRGASVEYFARIREVFGNPDRTETFNDGFADFVEACGA